MNYGRERRKVKQGVNGKPVGIVDDEWAVQLYATYKYKRMWRTQVRTQLQKVSNQFIVDRIRLHKQDKLYDLQACKK